MRKKITTAAALAALAGGLLLCGAMAGRMNAPMVDGYGRVIGNWGGDGQTITSPAARTPASAAPVHEGV